MNRNGIRSVIALAAVVAVAVLSLAPIAAGAATSARVAPVGEDSDLGEVCVRPSVSKEKDSVELSLLKGLTLLQAEASDKITILVESVGVTGDPPTVDDNDFTRIDNAVQAVALLGDGTVVRLVGVFDWTEGNAFASWAAADYGILAPSGVADVTLRATELGAAEIVGPGELGDPEIYYEGFIYCWGGAYQGWTVENLVVRGFDWAIGFFYDGTEDFNGLTVRNNRIVMHADTPGNYSAGLGETFQNIALHLAFGENQTIEGNEIVIPGDGNGDDTDPGAVLRAANVALQSNTSGGNVYDGLRITDNTIRITGAQAAVPEIIYGIWENSAGHTSNIEVSGNTFVNENAANDPALNMQRAFRVTSHSSETTTVSYSKNLAVGANIAIHWLGDNYNSNPQPGLWPVVVEGNTLLGNGTGIWAHTDGVDAKTTVSKNGELSDLRKALVVSNRIAGNVVGVRSDDAEVTALDNWWGCNEGPGAAGCDSALYNGTVGFLETDPWLVLGVGVDSRAVEIGFDNGVTATVRTNSEGNDLGGIGFPITPVDFTAVRGTVQSPVQTSLGEVVTLFTATDTGIGSVTASLDNASATVSFLITDDGVVRVRSVAETGDTPTLADNDYTRINDLVQMVSNNVSVHLEGTFDWTESFAAIAWGLGSDGVADTNDDFAIAAPPGFGNVTIGAAVPGDAVILGPGDVPTLDWETFLGMWDGDYSGWTVENLDVRGFDWSIVMFYTTGSDFNGVTIRDNRIEMPVDEPGNYGSGLGEPWQNVALHLAGGVDQTVEGNEIVIPGTALGDSSDPEAPIKAASVALQSNTHGGSHYDGLRIINNTIRITGAQATDPEWIYGIWENGNAHTSDIEVSGNTFVNEHPGNDPALNLQRAFRVTSHSSEETTVRYGDNSIEGANIGIHWLGDVYTSRPPATVLPVVVETNVLLGNHTGVWVHTDGLAVPTILEAAGKAASRKALPTSRLEGRAANVFGSPMTADAKADGPAFMSKAFLRFNRFAGNGVGLRSDDAEVIAENNWWACNEGPGTLDCDNALFSGDFGFLDADPWLLLGLSAVPNQVQVGNQSTATVALDVNSDGQDLSAYGSIADGTPVGYAATGGVIDPTATSTVSAQASATYTAGATVGDYQVSATVDNETVSVAMTVVAWADLEVTVDPDSQSRDDGEQAEVTITVTNDGPLAAMGATVSVDFPDGLAGVAWTCSGSGGGVCGAAGLGDVTEFVDLPVGASVTFTASGAVPDPFFGMMMVTASAAPPTGITDPDPADNQAEARILSGVVFMDGFESGDTSAWTATVGSSL